LVPSCRDYCHTALLAFRLRFVTVVPLWLKLLLPVLCHISCVHVALRCGLFVLLMGGLPMTFGCVVLLLRRLPPRINRATCYICVHATVLYLIAGCHAGYYYTAFWFIAIMTAFIALLPCRSAG